MSISPASQSSSPSSTPPVASPPPGLSYEPQPPSRLLDDDEPASVLFGIIALAILAYWIMAPALYQLLIGHPLFPKTATTQPVQMSPHDEVFLSAVCPAVGLVVLIVFNLLWRSHPFARLGVSLGKLWRSGWWQGILAAIIILPTMFGVVLLTQKFWNAIHFPHPDEHDLLRILGDEPSTFVRRLIIITAVVLAPLAEEFFFRGMLQSAIKKLVDPGGRMKWLATSISIVMVSIFFALAHGALWMMPPLFFFSLCLGYAYAFTGNLWVSIIVHAAFNATSLITFLASRHG